MTKLVLNDVASLANTTSAKQVLNDNFAAIEEALENTLSRDGSTPNQMEADIDLNSNDLLNVASIDASEYLLNGVPLAQSVAYSNKRFQLLSGNGLQTEFTLELDPGSLGNLEVSIDGVMQRPGLDYAYDGLTLAFTSAPADGEDNILVRYDEALPVGAVDIGALTFQQKGAGSQIRELEEKAQDFVTAFDFIPQSQHEDITNGVNVVDQHARINAGLTAHKLLTIPPGEYHLEDMITVPLGYNLRGSGRRKTILRVGPSFNMLAEGVIRFAPGADAGEISDMTIIFEQPDSAVVGDYYQYPPAIYAVDNPRAKISNMRIAMCWDGIDMSGNSGGLTIDDLELSMFNKGIIIDGSLDTNRINNLHLWPFASETQGVMTTNQRLVHRNAYGIYSGRCDGLVISNSLIFDVRKGIYLYSPGAGLYTIGNWSNIAFDGDGGMHVIGDGRVEVGTVYFTKDSADGNWLTQTGGIVEISTARMVNSVTPIAGNGLIEVSGGTLNLSNVEMERGFLDSTFLYASGTATVNLHGAMLSSDATAAFTKPAIHLTGSVRGNLTGITANPKTGGSGSLITIDNDIGVNVASVQAPGWTIDGPSARSNTRVESQDAFSGGVDSAGVSTGLPFGWTCSRAGVGNYLVNHGLNLAAVRDMTFVPIPEGTAFASWDVTNSTTGSARIRTFDAAGAAVDSAFSFICRRRR